MAWTTTSTGEKGWMTGGGAFFPQSEMGLTQRVPVQSWYDAVELENAGGTADQRSGFGWLPNPVMTPGGGGISQQDINAMIQAAMDPYLKALRAQQTKFSDSYGDRTGAGGPFGFLSAPMTFNKPKQTGEQWSFSRPSYGQPANRGFYPGGYPQFQQPSMPSSTQGLSGLFSDPYLLTLAETLFGGSSWLPKATTA